MPVVQDELDFPPEEIGLLDGLLNRKRDAWSPQESRSSFAKAGAYLSLPPVPDSVIRRLLIWDLLGVRPHLCCVGQQPGEAAVGLAEALVVPLLGGPGQPVGANLNWTRTNFVQRAAAGWINTRWFMMSHYDFRIGCNPLLQRGGSTPFCNRAVQIKNQQQQQHEPGSLLDLAD